jgi:DNA mismatch repair protein MutH
LTNRVINIFIKAKMNSDQTPQFIAHSDAELCRRAKKLAGLTLRQVAQQLGMKVPTQTKTHKGIIGNLLEVYLGATAGSKPGPDFPELGIELKTIPIDHRGQPLESTFVCVTPLLNIRGMTWESSNVRKKLKKVLWIPVEGSREIPVADRRVGHYLLWTPSQDEEAMLRQDWETHMEQIALGEIESITAKQGQILQIRPKAANNQQTTQTIGPSGQLIKTLPRGFYLRSLFTGAILNRYFM